MLYLIQAKEYKKVMRNRKVNGGQTPFLYAKMPNGKYYKTDLKNMAGVKELDDLRKQIKADISGTQLTMFDEQVE